MVLQQFARSSLLQQRRFAENVSLLGSRMFPPSCNKFLQTAHLPGQQRTNGCTRTSHSSQKRIMPP
jgi:hypothetical protein